MASTYNISRNQQVMSLFKINVKEKCYPWQKSTDRLAITWV